uniref:acyl carrier protein n=1 Tax=Nocardia suismassiliense TaxID=2077092 RepID=UPI003F49AE9A
MATGCCSPPSAAALPGARHHADLARTRSTQHIRHPANRHRRTQLFELLKSVMNEVLLLDVDGVCPDASREDACLDALAVVELSMVLSQHHGIEITDDELFELDTVSEIVEPMEKRNETAA